MGQEKVNKGYDGDDQEDEFNGPAGLERRDVLKSETDDLLDEIDEVLEENAEEFVGAYIQKGGQ
jgi:ubiquitin-like protein Pup